MKIKTLNDVLLHKLGDLYSAETQLVKALPHLAEATTSVELKAAFTEHLEQTNIHVKRLQEIFSNLGQVPAKVTCEGMKGLIRECVETVRTTEDNSAARDAAIIGAAQRIEHYEIAGYGTAETHAAVLGHNRIRELLQETLDEEKKADRNLNDLAKSSINNQAKEEVRV